jgi:predicted AlkP superfamily pyrophosphatase or phosphodiesterase
MTKLTLELIKKSDELIFDIIESIKPWQYRERNLSIITLPDLDGIGHRCGPHSREVCSHLEKIDNRISHLINKQNLIMLYYIIQ